MSIEHNNIAHALDKAARHFASANRLNAALVRVVVALEEIAADQYTGGKMRAKLTRLADATRADIRSAGFSDGDRPAATL